MIASQLLEELVHYKMPYGKYKDWPICKLPENYLVWLVNNALPKGKLGMLIATMYEIRLNGLEDLLEPIKRNAFNK